MRPARRRLVIDGFTGLGKPVFLSEFGGIACIKEGDGKGWGYSSVRDGAELLERYQALMEAIHRCKPLSGFCYTQLTDTFLEKNGLLTEERQPKAPIEALAKATRGADAQWNDWYIDPLGHSEIWRGRRAGDLPGEWIVAATLTEVGAHGPGGDETPGGGDGAGNRARKAA